MWDDVKDRLSELVGKIRISLEVGKLISAEDYVLALRMIAVMIREGETLLKKYDAVINPTTPRSPRRVGRENDIGFRGRKEEFDKKSTVAHDLGVFCSFSNVTGQPSITVPCGIDSNGISIGLHIGGPSFREEVIFKIAHAYERKTSWHTRWPAI